MQNPEESPFQPHHTAALEALRGRGVIIPWPEQVFIGREVPLEAIGKGAVLHPFCRITGAGTVIGAGTVVGQGGAATLHDTRLGADCRIAHLGPVHLKRVWCGAGTALGCGVGEDTVFLGQEEGGEGLSTGYGFRVRKGTLYEEGANSAQHTDTKMTILFPWVTLGSNVNWCDVLMAGGTGAELGRMSELGSGTIHFNFTPRGDKATASCFGTVRSGVFLNQPPVFLSGNCSMIGPLEADFGAVTTAGGRYRGRLKAGLNPGEPPPVLSSEFSLEVYGSIKRSYDSQVRYIGELAALDAWYAQARALLATGHAARRALYAAGGEMVRLNITERIQQLAGLTAALDASLAALRRGGGDDPRIAQQQALLERWPRIEESLRAFSAGQDAMPSILREALEAGAVTEGSYTRIIKGLPAQAVVQGRAWLSAIAERVASPELFAQVPPIGSSR